MRIPLASKKSTADWKIYSDGHYGNDSRCPFFFDENSSEEDKALFGVGEIGDYSRKCRAKGGGICSGTGHLVMDGDILISAAHVF
ncbi:MAG: hypothetical protein IPK68_21545 [Bdellovibrionales bacterium]|nr:hypothetical protein [Bdellovibrionales bacterium]